MELSAAERQVDTGFNPWSMTRSQAAASTLLPFTLQMNQEPNKGSANQPARGKHTAVLSAKPGGRQRTDGWETRTGFTEHQTAVTHLSAALLQEKMEKMHSCRGRCTERFGNLHNSEGETGG
ncbi:hypothetical protein DPEC_G00287500 [Dallia pectoralis]|uniref:Uncharacterized protein n=1 Tax=Dallia pectoralis TaxID=75939 RepID=A0ACC2FKG7_DALPE|nr:hypothetical protein DPEC_G00287500 [Dallia pectoralis]